MNYPGSDKKFKVTTTHPDFQLTEDDFRIVIRDRYGRPRQTVNKDDCFWDADGNYYFTVEDIRRGVYFAFFKGSYEDDDYDKQRRVFTDVQELYRVGYRGCPCKTKGEPPYCRYEHAVHYEEVWTVSVDGDDYLADRDGKYILTADGKRICFKSDKAKQIGDMGKVRLDTLTGDEFKQLIEGNNPNGDIDTIPEMLRAAQGIPDDTTIKEQIDEEVAESDVERVTPDDLAGFEI